MSDHVPTHRGKPNTRTDPPISEKAFEQEVQDELRQQQAKALKNQLKLAKAWRKRAASFKKAAKRIDLLLLPDDEKGANRINLLSQTRKRGSTILGRPA